MIPYDPSMSDCSAGTRSAQTRWPKFWSLQKMSKKLSYFLKQKIAVIHAKSFFCSKTFQKSRFFNIELLMSQTLFWK